MYKENKKRFMIIFNTWSEYSFSEDITEFDNLEDTQEHINLIEEVYKDYDEKDSKGYSKKIGYVLLDFSKQKILKWGNSGEIYRCGRKYDKLELKDIFFRGNDEIPEDYQWDSGEYEGWLQYRWGDGKNAINYGENKETLKKFTGSKISTLDNPSDNEEDLLTSEEDIVQDKFNRDIEKELLCQKIDRW